MSNQKITQALKSGNREIISFANYKTLHLIPSLNRKVEPKHVEKLVSSVKMMGVIRDVVVVKTNLLGGGIKTVIIDGQNLYCALVQLKMGIPVRYINVTSKEDLIHKMAMLNASSKVWTFKDYVHAFSDINDDYAQLELYKHRYQTLEYPIVIAAACGENTSGRFADIKKGKFKIENRIETQRKLDLLHQFFGIIGRGGHIGAKKYFTREYLEFLKKQGTAYDHKKFKTFLSNNLDKLTYSNVPPAGELVKLFSKYDKNK